MKKIFTVSLCLFVTLLCVFAEGQLEQHSETISTFYSSEYENEIESDVVVDLSNATVSNDLVSVKYKDSNLQIDYTGENPINLELTGNINSTVIINSDNSDITVVLNKVEINATSLPAMQLKSSVTYTIFVKGNTMNTISDSLENTKKGAITSGGNVVFDGNGNLVLNVNKKHGIKTDGGVTINSGNINIVGSSNAEGNMISADTYFVMNGGTVNISANGNVNGSESKGIKVNGVEGKDFACGYIEINDGFLNVYSVGKAITAGWKAEEDGTTETLDDDPIPDVYINGGQISIVTVGTPREDTYTNGVSNDDGLSPEGIEAKHNLYINGGNIRVESTDDCVNAGNAIFVSGGYSYLASSLNDSFDSNGTIEISGGTVFTYSTSMEQAFDCDNDSNFTYKGGTYIGLGSGNNIPKGSETSCYSIAYGNEVFTSGKDVALLDSNGNLIIGFCIPSQIRNANTIVIGSEKIKQGQNYSLCYGKLTNTTDDGLSSQNSAFKKYSEIASFTMNSFTESQGRIGMNVGGDMGGMRGMGMFQGQGRMPFDNNMPNNMPNDMPFGRPENQEVLLPDKVVITGTLTEDEARQAIEYLMQNFFTFW